MDKLLLTVLVALELCFYDPIVLAYSDASVFFTGMHVSVSAGSIS